MSLRIIFEVNHRGQNIDLRLITETTSSVTDREKVIGKLAKDCLDAMLAEMHAAAEEQGVKFTHTKEGA